MGSEYLNLLSGRSVKAVEKLSKVPDHITFLKPKLQFVCSAIVKSVLVRNNMKYEDLSYIGRHEYKISLPQEWLEMTDLDVLDDFGKTLLFYAFDTRTDPNILTNVNKPI